MATWIGEQLLGALASELVSGLVDALFGVDQATIIVQSILKEMKAANQHLENSFNLAIDRAKYKEAVTHVETWIEEFNEGLAKMAKDPADDKKLRRLEESLGDPTNGVHFYINNINSVLVDSDNTGLSMIKNFSNRLEEDLCKEDDDWAEDKSIKWYLTAMEDFLVSLFPVQRAAWTLRLYLVRNDKQDLEAYRKQMDTTFAAQVQHAHDCFHPVIKSLKPNFTTAAREFWFNLKEANSDRVLWNDEGTITLSERPGYGKECQWKLYKTIEDLNVDWLMNRDKDNEFLISTETQSGSGMFGGGYGKIYSLAVARDIVAPRLPELAVPWKLVPVKGKAEFKLKTKRNFDGVMWGYMKEILNASFVTTFISEVS